MESTEEPAHTPRPTVLRIERAPTAAAVREQVSRAADSGFDGIELPQHVIRATLSSTNAAPAPGGRCRRREEGMGLGLPVVAVAARLHSTKVAQAREDLIHGLDVAAGLGARCLNVTIPPVVRTGDSFGFTRYQDAVNFTFALLKRCRLNLESSGVVLGLEAPAEACLLSPIEVREFVDAVNCWAVGVCVVAPIAQRFGSAADWVRTLGSRVHTVRGHTLDSLDAAVLRHVPADRPFIVVPGSAS